MTQASLGALIYPLQVIQLQHLKGFDIYDVGAMGYFNPQAYLLALTFQKYIFLG